MASNNPNTASAAPPKKRKAMSVLGFFGIILGLSVGWFLIRVVIGIVVGLVARHVFGASGNTACFAGVMGYLLPAFVLSMLELFGGDERKKGQPGR